MALLQCNAGHGLHLNITKLQSQPGQFHTEFFTTQVHDQGVEIRKPLVFTGGGETLRAIRAEINFALGE